MIGWQQIIFPYLPALIWLYAMIGWSEYDRAAESIARLNRLDILYGTPYKTRLACFKAHPFKGSVTFSPFVQLLYVLPVGLDMVGRNFLIFDRSPQAADPKSEKSSRSPQTQKCQEINEDNGQTHKIYQIQNCGTMYMDSFNACGVRMENCGNHVPQVTCSLSFSPHFCSHESHLTWKYHIIQITVLGLLAMREFCTHNLMQSPMPVVCGPLRHLPLNMLNMYL
jgi:hypothetical protein